MFAVVRTGGKQYRVAPGDKIVVEKLDGEAGSRVDISDVLLAGDGANLQSVEGLTVAAEIVAQAKADKVTIFKKRRRHNYRRKKGHRQQHTILKIVAIGDQRADDKGAKAAKPAKSAAAPASATEASPAVEEQTVPNPAPDNPEQANPGAGQASADEGTKAAKPRKPKAAKAASTDDAAPANGGDNESSKA